MNITFAKRRAIDKRSYHKNPAEGIIPFILGYFESQNKRVPITKQSAAERRSQYALKRHTSFCS